MLAAGVVKLGWLNAFTSIHHGLDRLKQLQLLLPPLPNGFRASACATVDRTTMRRSSFTCEKGGATTVWAVRRR
jgi:hypothetical protein